MFNFSGMKRDALRKPTYFDHGSFLLCRPGKNYKINAAVSVIKADKPVLYDVGVRKEMITNVKRALSTFDKKPIDVGFAIISHIHYDHIMNVVFFNKVFPNCKVILHETSYNQLVLLEKQFVRKYDSKTSIRTTNFWKSIVIATYLRKKQMYVCKDNDYIPCRDLKLRLIHTPGHAAGHICLLDCSNKVLFLGDHLPYTPWLDISENSIDNMIGSIKKLLNLNSNEVKFSVRNHGNLRENWREVYPWEQERERFQKHLELITQSVDEVHKLLINNPLNIAQIARKIYKTKDLNDYNPVMNTFFLPPWVSWITCYLLKLLKENKVKQVGKKWIAI